MQLGSIIQDSRKLDRFPLLLCSKTRGLEPAMSFKNSVGKKERGAKCMKLNSLLSMLVLNVYWIHGKKDKTNEEFYSSHFPVFIIFVS